MKIEGKDIKIYIGSFAVGKEEKSYQPMPSVDKLREWDRKLLNRYHPKSFPLNTNCTFCAFGPCDLTNNRKGACGMKLDIQIAREYLNLTLMGAAAHTAHGRHLLHLLKEKFGALKELKVAENTEIIAPNTSLITGISPKFLIDLESALGYAEQEITHLVSSLHMGQEGSAFDYYSKAFHAGMVDHLGMEICDIAQIAAFDFPKGDPTPKLIESGYSSINKNKPIVLCVGHNVATSVEIIDYAESNNLDVEMCGICCTALDMGRYTANKKTQSKVIGPLSYQLIYIRSGIPDVIVTDEQCVRVDTVELAQEQKIPVIATSDKACYGFVDYSEKIKNKEISIDVVVSKLAFGEIDGCYISDLEIAGEVAAKTAILVKQRKSAEQKIDIDPFELADNCINCTLCNQACPIKLNPHSVIEKIKLMREREKIKEKEKEFEGYKKIPVELSEKKKTIDKIKELLDEGCYTQVEIANKIGTTKQNVAAFIKKIKKERKEKKLPFYEYKEGKEIFMSFKPILKSQVNACVSCGLCYKKCPNSINIPEIIQAIKKEEEIERNVKIVNALKKCSSCKLCETACPKKIEISKIIDEQKKKYNIVREIKEISDEEMKKIADSCLFCGRCESWCPKKIRIPNIFSKIVSERFEHEKAKLSPGRGAIQDVEIRRVGAPIVIGDIPGVIAAVGCSLYPKGGKELVEIAEEFLKRGYIFVTSGCSAMTLGIESVNLDPEGKGRSLYERYSGEFNGGCLVNVGSCVANSHITGAAIKIASIFAKRNLFGNYEEIADYLYNRVGAVGLVWGTMSAKALAIGNGVMRLGIPVVWGPSGIKYRSQFLSDEKTSWLTYEAYGKGENGMIDVGPAPEHLSVVAKDVKEAKVLLAKLCMRPNDSVGGRTKKLTHYIEIYRNIYNKIPDDVYKFIRTEKEIPQTVKDEVMEILKIHNWKPKYMAAGAFGDPTMLERMVKK